jgi:hypothetical protein
LKDAALEFEYRRPEIEKALMAATDIASLEAALRSVVELASDLGKPDVYGHKLFAPGLDAAVPTVARRLGFTDVPLAKSNENICIVATQFYATGGHTKVGFDIAGLIGGERTSVIFTDVYGKLKHTDLIGARTLDAPMQRRADVLLGGRDLVGKAVELYNLLAAIRPSRIFMLTHHFDMVAAVALWPFRDIVEFLHHADHVPSIGATLAFSAHVDLTWTCHQACRRAELFPHYAGMTVRMSSDSRVATSTPDAPLRIATCGPVAKYRGGATYRWTDFAAAALAVEDACLIHIGPAPEDFRQQIADELTAAGIDPARYVFIGQVPDLAAALVAQRPNLYLASYPVSGGKANLEAMAVGLPTLAPVDEHSPPLLQFDFPASSWTRIGSPAELRERLADGRRPSFGGPQIAAIVADELVRFERYVLGEALAERPAV